MISIIVACDERNVIGRDNYIPWKISSDMKRFKTITTGHTVVMGRKTFESIGRPLSNRHNIVITSRPFVHAGVTVVNSFEEAFLILDHSKENFIIGGSSVYEYFLPLADKLYITKVQADVGGNVYFPEIPNNFRIVEQTLVDDVLDDYPHMFSIFYRERT